MSASQPQDEVEPPGAGPGFRVSLPSFEGPLDLLLHLIREHRVDLLDIPIALITEKYLEHLEAMKAIDLDVAGEFVVMASTLLHMKSRLLLPREEQAGSPQASDAASEAKDPRAELVRRLLEYQKYKEVAAQLSASNVLDRHVFPRRVAVESVPFDPGEVGLTEFSVYRLIEALDRVLAALEPRRQHEVIKERLSLSQAMRQLATRVLAAGPGEAVPFTALFEGQVARSQVVITFLALLEMCKLKLLRVRQDEGSDTLLVSPRSDALHAFGATGPTEEVDREYA